MIYFTKKDTAELRARIEQLVNDPFKVADMKIPDSPPPEKANMNDEDEPQFPGA